MFFLLSLAFIALADAHGSGVWRDPGHYVSDQSLAGLRIVSEYPPHVLTMIGTEDGAKWWMIKGSCSGEFMTDIHFDFSSKGGPSDLQGKWALIDGVETITWSDGNKWDRLAAPTAAFETTVIGTSHGLFLDKNHVSPGTFKGVRFIAETPHHILNFIGSDDGETWWYIKGDCHGPGTPADGSYKFVGKEYIGADFTPKGGPKIFGWWDHHTYINWSDGNSWIKPPELAEEPAAASRVEPSAASFSGGYGQAGSVLALATVGLVLGGLIVSVRERRARLAAAEQPVPAQL